MFSCAVCRSCRLYPATLTEPSVALEVIQPRGAPLATTSVLTTAAMSMPPRAAIVSEPERTPAETWVPPMMSWLT